MWFAELDEYSSQKERNMIQQNQRNTNCKIQVEWLEKCTSSTLHSSGLHQITADGTKSWLSDDLRNTVHKKREIWFAESDNYSSQKGGNTVHRIREI